MTELNLEIIFWTLITIFILVVVVALKKRLLDKFQVTIIDLSIAIIPFVIWLLLSGKLTEVTVGDISFKTAIEKVQAKTITESNLDNLDVQSTPSVLKAGLNKLTMW